MHEILQKYAIKYLQSLKKNAQMENINKSLRKMCHMEHMEI